MTPVPPGGPPPKAITAARIVLAIALFGCLCFTAGRYSAPAQVEIREVEKEKLVFRELATEDITRGFTFAKTVEKTVWRDVETRPDGTTIDRSIVHEGAREGASSSETTRRTEERAGELEREKSTVTITTLRPTWSAGVLVGATWKEPALPIAGPLVLGAVVELRLGQSPFTVGAWGTTQGAIGVIGRAEF